MTMAQQYNEHAAIALRSCRPQLDRLGVAIVGILGNDDHTYGYHLSKARLLGTGMTNDASLFGAKNVPCVDDRAACAIDYAMDWPASGEHLEDTRRRAAAGELHQITQLIGDPDMIPGAPRDIRDACYAAPKTGWRWVNYSGEGHVTWAHIGIGRRYSNDADFGQKLFGKWNRTGLIVPDQEEDMSANTVIPRPTNVNYPTPPGNPPAWPTSGATGEPTLAYMLHSMNAKLTGLGNAVHAFIRAEELDDKEAREHRKQALAELATVLAELREHDQEPAEPPAPTS